MGILEREQSYCISFTQSSCAINRRMPFAMLIAMLALAILALGIVFPAQAYAAQTYKLTVKCVIDNASEYPDETSGQFSYSCKPSNFWMAWSSTSCSTPSVLTREIQDMTFKNGDSITVSKESSSAMPFFMFVPNANTSSRLVFKGIDFGQGTAPLTYDNQGHASLATTGINWVQMTATKGTATLHFSYVGDLPQLNIDYKADLTGSKQIDYLGDGKKNKDTSRNGENDYRIYATAETGDETEDGYKSKDIVLVLDTSGSMEDPIAGGGRRIDALKSHVLSMLDQLGGDAENTFSVVTFATGANMLVDKGTVKQARRAIERLGNPVGGTAYYDALLDVNDLLSGASLNEGIVLFVSDGLPTGVNESILGSSSGYATDAPIAFNYAMMAASTLSGVDSFYSIYIGDNKGDASTLQTVTQAVPVSGEHFAAQATNSVELKSVLDLITKRLIRPNTTVSISDTLSEYVAYRGGTAKLTRQVENGKVETLVNGRDYSLQYDSATRTVKAVVDGTGTPHTKYVLSFDVSASVKAVEEWYGNDGTYPHVGDANTDYDGNETSSGKEGFYSNDYAEVALSWEGGGTSAVLPKPVIQVKPMPEETAAIEAQVTLYNMKMAPGLFEFNLVDEEGNVVSSAKNDANGAVHFVDVTFEEAGTWHFTIEPVIPSEGDPGWIEHMKYDDFSSAVTVTASVLGDEETAATGLNLDITYDPEAHYYCEYELRTTYQ